MQKHPRVRLFVGIDAGGTKTELLAAPDDGDEALVLTGPPAQVQQVGTERAAEVLADLLRTAQERRSEAHLVSVCAGLAGAGRAAEQDAVAAALSRTLGPSAPPTLHVVSDADVALEAAFEGGSGVLIVAGTGSIVLARSRTGAVSRSGGWGRVLGDEGSGYALGVAALRAVAAALDGGPATLIQPLLAQRFAITTADDLIRRVYREGWPLQEAAPLLLEAARAGDAVAEALLADQTERLARQTAWVAARTGDVDRTIALQGGLTSDATYRTALEDALARALPGWPVHTSRHRPVVGAWRLARARYRS